MRIPSRILNATKAWLERMSKQRSAWLQASRMKIDISSSATADLGGKCLEYIPFVTINGETTKYGKGRIVVGIG